MNQWTTHRSDFDELRKKLEEMATASGFVLNPDLERLEKVVGLMTENQLLAGRRFCPCKQSHPLDPGIDVVCPCPEWKSEIESDGHCFCRLFYAREDR